MRLLSTLAVCCIALLACSVMTADAAAHARRHTHSAHAHHHAPKTAPAHSAATRELDWRASVYRGVDRATLVDANTPTQVRLAFIPGGMAVSYATTAQQVPRLNVSWGLRVDAMVNSTVSTEETTYGTLWFYTALITHLEPATRYFYLIAGNSVPTSFVTARAAGDPTPFQTLIVGDMGLANSANTMMQMKRLESSIDFFQHVGDLSYADDFYLRANDTYEGSWDKWQDEMTPITSKAAYMSLPGNHEVTCMEVTPFICPNYQRNMTAYRNRFRMPSKESGGVANLWYSYDYGLVHFVNINTETDYPNSPMGPGTYYNAGPFGDQMAWLQQDLDKFIANRATTPWLIISGHRPVWSSGHEEAPIQAAFEALFRKYDVDIYMNGHVHWYERMWPTGEGGVPTQKNYDQPTAPVYIVNGAAGNVEGLQILSPQQPYTAVLADTVFGYGILGVNATSLHWTYYNSATAAVVDEIVINKKH